jgi:hypothetical protein
MAKVDFNSGGRFATQFGIASYMKCSTMIDLHGQEESP